VPEGQIAIGAGPLGTGDVVLPMHTGIFKPFTRRNFADNLEMLIPKPQGAYDAHHMLPVNVYDTRPEVRQVLHQVGVSIQDPHWGTWWGRSADGSHRRRGREFKQAWTDWLDSVDPNMLTFDDLVGHAESLASHYGLKWSGDGFYY
jgi:hypothetical protein